MCICGILGNGTQMCTLRKISLNSSLLTVKRSIVVFVLVYVTIIQGGQNLGTDNEENLFTS